jgi:hypothetical protein
MEPDDFSCFFNLSEYDLNKMRPISIVGNRYQPVRQLGQPVQEGREAVASGVVIDRKGLQLLTEAIQVVVRPDFIWKDDRYKKHVTSILPSAIELRDKAISFYLTAGPGEDFVVPVGQPMEAYLFLRDWERFGELPRSSPLPWIIGGLVGAGILTAVGFAVFGSD